MEYVADDARDIAAAASKIRNEERMAVDIDAACAEWLDMHGRRLGVERIAGEADYSYRVRLKTAIASSSVGG